MADAFSPRVGDKVVGSADPTERPNALLAIVRAAVDRFNDLGVLEDQGGFEQVDLPRLRVLTTLAFVP